MKTLKNNTLIYDEQCPLCVAYTGAFIRFGLLDDEGRTPYNKLESTTLMDLDIDKARNEIALIDKNSGKIIYGVASLSTILGNNWPILQKLTKVKVIAWLLEKTYKLISYNRKVIALSNERSADTCIPDYNIKYRIIYLVLSSIAISAILHSFSFALSPIIQPSNWAREILISIGQIGFQWMIMSLLQSKQKLTYLGHMITISLSGALLLIPYLVINIYLHLPFVALSYFGVVFLWMIYEHRRRIKLLSYPTFLTYSWILYRIILLSFIL